MTKECKICGNGILEQVDNIVLEISGYVFIVRGESCTSCKEEFPYQEETDRTIKVARQLGVWPEPLKLHRHFSKSGNGLVFRIPNDLEKQMHLDENMEIAISKIGNKIVIEPTAA